MKDGGIALLGICLIIVAAIGGGAYKYKYKAQDTIVVTGLGETDFTSDLIVWSGNVLATASNVETGYEQIEESKHKVREYLKYKGIPDSAVVFMFVNVNRQSEPIYANGQYVGQRNTNYELRQRFTVESTNVELVESVSREISSLIALGVQVESWEPDYFYTKLSDIKLTLIEKATQDACQRAEKIAKTTDSKLKKLAEAKMGVFQITGANSDESFTAGGNFNTASKNKKARITMRLVYHIK